MTTHTRPKFLAKARLTTIASHLTIALLCLSSPLVVTSATWAKPPTQNDAQHNINSTESSASNGGLDVPTVIQALKGKNSASALPGIIQALQGNGTASVLPGLIQALQNKDTTSALPGLIQALQGNDSQVSSNSTTSSSTSSCIIKNPISAVPELIQGLQDKNSLVRYFAASALGCLGEEAKSAIPALIQTLKDPDQSVRLVAAYALDKIGLSLQETAKNLSPTDLNQAISGFDSALKVLNDPLLKFPQQAISSILNPLQALKQERSSR